MIRQLKLMRLRYKLWLYQRGERNYEKMGCSSTWYTERGIPQLKAQIEDLMKVDYD